MVDISLKAQIACVRREIIRRAQIAPHLLATRRITPELASREEQEMTAVLQTLTILQNICHIRGWHNHPDVIIPMDGDQARRTVSSLPNRRPPLA